MGMTVQCPTCEKVYNLPKPPPRRVAAPCKKCGGKIIVDPEVVLSSNRAIKTPTEIASTNNSEKALRKKAEVVHKSRNGVSSAGNERIGEILERFFKSLPQWEPISLFYQDQIPDKATAKIPNIFKKYNINEERILLYYNNPQALGTCFVVTENNLYWRLPKFPGGGARRGKLPLEDIEHLELVEYSIPLVNKMRLYDRLRNKWGFTLSIMCNGKKLGVIGSLNRKERTILRLLFDKINLGNGNPTNEEIEILGSLPSGTEETWSPCPRCDSKRVKESSTVFWVFIGLVICITFGMSYQLSWWGSILLGFGLYTACELFIGKIWKCKDCGNTWKPEPQSAF